MGKDCSVSEIRSCRRKIIISLSGRSQRNTVWLWTRASEFLMEILGIVTAIHTYDETVEVEFDEKER